LGGRDIQKTEIAAIKQSDSQEKCPFIIGYPVGAKPLSEKQEKQIKDIIQPVMDKYGNEFTGMQNSANAMGTDAPCGAYIGGVFNTKHPQPILVGPSSLELYKPKFRLIQGSEAENIKSSFEAAKKHTNKAVAAIVSGAKASEGYNSPYTEDYKEEHLFKSCHGMIRAMTLFAGQEDNCFFEFALGKNTSKVSSCIPCSIFMTAFGMPASSTHLGRGDNWGLPKEFRENAKNVVDHYYFKWQTNICQYFDFGIQALRAGKALPLHVDKKTGKPYFGYSAGEDTPPIDVFIKQKCKTEKDDLPGIFLESLTYEKSFKDRIKDTFARKR
jgi:hypothetical protein